MNWVIAAGLLAAGLAVIRWPLLIDPDLSSGPAAAATLAGALFGAAALFAGAQINEVARRRDAEIELQNQQHRVRAILDNEFIRVCVNLMQEASDLSKVRQNSLCTLDFREPLPTPIFDDLKSEMLCLPENEIDALCTFYGGLGQTRRLIRDETRALGLASVLGHMLHDLRTAEEVARKVWPTRKVHLPNEHAALLADKLREQAAAVAKALEL
jgi:hypothetical protein